MGNKLQKIKINTQEWTWKQSNIYQSKIDGYQVEMYQIIIPENYLNTYLHSYAKRQIQTTPYVRVIQFHNNQDGCVVIQHSFTVFTERIVRLPSLQLSYYEAIFLLQQLLSTLKILFDTYGLFKIDANMIGVNLQGKVKFWMSENFAESFKSTRMIQINKNEETNLLNSIIQMVNIQIYEQKFSNILFLKNNSQNINNLLTKLSDISQHNSFKIDKIFLDRNHYKQKFIQYQKQSQLIIKKKTINLNKNNLSRVTIIHPIQNHNPNIYKISRIVYTSPKQPIQSKFINSTTNGSFIKSSQIVSNQKDSGNYLKFNKISDQQRYNSTQSNEKKQPRQNMKQFNFESPANNRRITYSRNYSYQNEKNNEMKFKEYLEKNDQKIPEIDSQLIIFPNKTKDEKQKKYESQQQKRIQRSLSDSDILKQLLEI